MDKQKGTLTKMHERDGKRKIAQIKRRIDTTCYNIELSKEIIADTASDTHRRKLIEKNNQREHAVGSMQKEIRDIEQTMEARSQEVST